MNEALVLVDNLSFRGL